MDLTLIRGHTFTARDGLANIEVGVYKVEGFGPRIIPVTRDGEGALRKPRARNCLHGRPLLPSHFDTKPGDAAGYAQLCQSCAFEARVILKIPE